MAKRSEDDYELYLYTIDVYIRLVGALPLDKSLAQFGVQNFSEIGNLDIDDRDFAAVAMRLMLHADRRRIEKLIDVPEYMRILALAPYVAERERLLLRFSDFLRAAGVKPLSRCGEEAAVVSYGSKGFERSIKGSPSWRNLQGRDLGPADIEQIAQATSIGDACILDVV